MASPHLLFLSFPKIRPNLPKPQPQPRLSSRARAASDTRRPLPGEAARRRREKRQEPARKPSSVACCYGCGAPLRTADEGAPGYVEPATYDLGSANVGKSAFTDALLRTMAYKDPVAAAAQKYKTIQSAIPGTTLGPIQIEAFLGGGMYKKANDTDLGLSGNSLFWGGLVRIDAVKALPRTRLTFYGPKKLKISMVPTTEADEFYKREVGVTLTPRTGEERAEGWPGLQGVRQLQIKYEERDSNPDGSVEDEDDDRGELHLTVHVPKPVEIFVRPPLPVGKAAPRWYRYQELTEEEEELRPKWHY